MVRRTSNFANMQVRACLRGMGSAGSAGLRLRVGFKVWRSGAGASLAEGCGFMIQFVRS